MLNRAGMDERSDGGTMTARPNPQGPQMADESMVRNLSAQAEAIWPQESLWIERYDLPERPRVLEVGCGTGEFVSRLGPLLPRAWIVGVDLIRPHLDLALRNSAGLAEQVNLLAASGYALPFPDAAFDLTVCRHLLQAVTDPGAILDEVLRVTRPAGRLHVLAEDYSMIHFHPVDVDCDRFWLDGPIRFAEEIDTDLRSGRKIPAWLAARGVREITVRYVVVDTLRVPRERFAEIWTAWRDGFTDVIAAHSRYTRDEVTAHWTTMIECLHNPEGYAVWLIPVISGVLPPKEE